MKTRATILILFLLILSSSFSAMAQKADITGEWKLNREKTVLADSRLFLSKISINLKGDSLLTTRVYENENGEEYPFDEKLSLNGKECKIFVYDMPRTTKATKAADGSINIESVTTFYTDNGDESLIAKETWKVDPDGKALTIGFTNKMSAGEATGTSYYNKVK
jgi:hypothetical protein